MLFCFPFSLYHGKLVRISKWSVLLRNKVLIVDVIVSSLWSFQLVHKRGESVVDFSVIVKFSNSKRFYFTMSFLLVNYEITRILLCLRISFLHSPEAVIQMCSVKIEVVKIWKGVCKNMLKAWNFTKNEVQGRCLDNNFPNKYSWKRYQVYTFDQWFNGRPMIRQLTDPNVKWR